MLDNAKDLDHDYWGLDIDVAALEVHEALMASCKMLDIAEITDREDRLRLLPALIQTNCQQRILAELQEIKAALMGAEPE